MLAHLLAAVLVAVVASPVAAQVIRVDHRGPAYPAGFFDTLQPGTPVATRPGLVWQHDGMGWLQAPAVDAAPPQNAPACDPRPDPYAEPDRAAACSAWDVANRPPTPPSIPEYVVDAVYRDRTQMTTFRIAVLAVSRALEGVPVVTVERIAPVAGSVFSFRIDEPEAQRWERVP